MSKRTHVAFGLLLAALLFKVNLASFVPIVILSSMLPDLDLLLRSLLLIKHRKTFHNVWSLDLVCASATRLVPDVFPFIAAGILSHFIMGSLTKTGVMRLYPFSKSKLSGPFRTGGIFDNFLFLASILGLGYVLTQDLIPL
ncbi:MAG: metal-dependent hydrolase [Candidatus Korarchaeum sp.]|nr:metal-dependent hydrolase [Candidatus Korarchaeum sp.]MDW8036243.1 metal-dependent hydrolase [Candidatus Korarchaeum sp.]